ncbi:hypothetical protein EV181_007395, partial [Coemansia sp. RSA 532]
MAPSPAQLGDATVRDADTEHEKQQFLSPTSHSVHRSHTVGLVPKLELGDAPSAPYTHSINEIPVSPLVAASTAGEHYPTNRLSYAHQQSVSGWDKVFASMSQRNEGGADEANHVHVKSPLRVPGLGEDSLDVQSDDNQHENHAYGHTVDRDLGQGMMQGAAHRGRSNTGFSSTGSGIPDHGSIASTTALSPGSVQLGAD